MGEWPFIQAHDNKSYLKENGKWANSLLKSIVPIY